MVPAIANDAHEQRLKALVAETGADVPISLSSEILPEFREYERTLVTVMNVYVRPRMRHYLQRLGDKLRALGLDVHQAAQVILDFVLDKRLVSCGKMPAQEEARCISMLHDTKPTICSSSRVFGRAYQSPTQ